MRHQLYFIILFVLLSVSYGEISGPLTSNRDKSEDEEIDSDSKQISIEDIDDKEMDKIKDALKEMENFLSKGLANSPTLDETDTTVRIIKSRDSDSDIDSSEKDLSDEDSEDRVQVFEKVQKWMKTLMLLGHDSISDSKAEETEDPEETLKLLLSLPEEPVVELTPEEIKNEEIYQAGMAHLNKSQGDKSLGYRMLFQAASKGHKGAQIKIAWGKLFGSHMDQNIADALGIFESLAKTGNAEAHTGLGLMYASGIGLNVSQPKALIHLTIGALANSTWAQMALGYRYWAGVTVPAACDKALYFYRKVATKVANEVSLSGGAAIQRVRILDEHENSGVNTYTLYNDLIEYYRLMAEKGDIPTQVGLGQLHYQGVRGVPLDIQKAMRYFQQAADAGNAEAMAYLGKIYLEGSDSVKADNETALKYFRKAAELNNPVGQSGLGLMYLHGRGVPKDTNQALKYFKLAADQGWVDGQLQLGNMYFGGIGVRRDFKMANKYYYLASQSNHVLAIYHLGQMHAEGLGVLRSCPTAVEFFKTVAERGKWGEQLMLAFHEYRQFEKNKAFVQFAIMAQLGYEIAQSNAACLLDRGEVSLFGGPPEDYVRALTYWSRSAAQGYSPAQVKLGDYHYYGLGTPVDYETAASHYRLASEQQNNAQAMFNLGYMHEQGLGMRRDVHLAKRCYDLAAETSPDAKVPVALALLKLMIVFNLESLQENPLSALFSMDESFLSNWDIYLITILTAILGAVIYFRRPRAVQQPNN